MNISKSLAPVWEERLMQADIKTHISFPMPVH